MSSKRKEYKVDDRVEKAAHFFTILHARKMLPQDSQSPLPWEQKGLDVKAMDQIFAQQVRHKSPKNKDENTPCAETVAAAAMLALSNTTNAARCRVQEIDGGRCLGASHPRPRSWLVSDRGEGGGGGALGLLVNLKKTRKVKGACQLETTSITTVVKE